jgi:hypothetical protein
MLAGAEAGVVVCGVAGRAAASAASGVVFFRGPSEALSPSTRADALRLRVAEGVVVLCTPSLAVDDETGACE